MNDVDFGPFKTSSLEPVKHHLHWCLLCGKGYKGRITRKHYALEGGCFLGREERLWKNGFRRYEQAAPFPKVGPHYTKKLCNFLRTQGLLRGLLGKQHDDPKVESEAEVVLYVHEGWKQILTGIEYEWLMRNPLRESHQWVGSFEVFACVPAQYQYTLTEAIFRAMKPIIETLANNQSHEQPGVILSWLDGFLDKVDDVTAKDHLVAITHFLRTKFPPSTWQVMTS